MYENKDISTLPAKQWGLKDETTNNGFKELF
jgi:hypothetical protein